MGCQSNMCVKFGLFVTLMMVAYVLADKTAKKKIYIQEDRRLQTDEVIEKMTGKNYHLSLPESSVIKGMSSEYKDGRSRYDKFRTFSSSIWTPYSTMETVESEIIEGATKGNEDFNKQCSEDMFLTQIDAVYFPNYQDQLFEFRCSSFLDVTRINCEWTDYVNGQDKKEDFTFDCDENKAISGIKSKASETRCDRTFSFFCCDFYIGEWPKAKAEKYIQRLDKESDNSREEVINFFDDLGKISSNCDRFENHFGVNFCEMESGKRRDNRHGYEETLEDQTKNSELQTKVNASNDRDFDDRKNEATKICDIDHVIKPRTKTANFLKKIVVLLADPDYDVQDFRSSSQALNKFKICTEGMLHFFAEIHKIDVDVGNMHWENAAFEVMKTAEEKHEIEFIKNEKLSDRRNVMVDFNLDSHMIMIVLPDSVHFDGNYGFALMHSGFSVIKANETKDGRFVLHELAHNLGMKHSSTVDDEYGDDRCIMGQARNKNICFNAPKSEYLGLYRQETVVVYAKKSKCEATFLLADLQQYLFQKRSIFKTHGFFYVIVKVPDTFHDTYFMYYAEDTTISVVIGGTGEIIDADADILFYEKGSMRVFELKQGEQREYNGVFYKHCKHLMDEKRVAFLLVRTYSDAPCPSQTSERFNLALGQPVSYSGQKSNYPASHGNDGNNKNMAHSHGNHIKNHYWQVTLASDRSLIDEVIIYNRKDCCQDRIRGGKVEVLDSEKKVIATRPINSASGVIKVDIGGIEGAAVRISPRSYKHLNFRECVVNGREYLGSSRSAIPPLFTKVRANEFLSLRGARFDPQNNVITSIDNGDVLFSKLVNFGGKGMTKSIMFCYLTERANIGWIDIRLDAVDGKRIGAFRPNPKATGGWNKFVTRGILLDDDISGVHNVIILSKSANSIFNLKWFKLSASNLAPPLSANVRYLVVASSSVRKVCKDIETCKSYLMDNFSKGKSPSRMICEVTNGTVKDDPHYIGGQRQSLGLKAGFNRYWAGWNEINYMNDVCQKYCDSRGNTCGLA